MNRLLYIVLITAMLAGLFSVNKINIHLVQERKENGITQADPVINAPPLVVFTTVALGGFRGIIADFLWMRSTKLQNEGKFFELVQLADWITKLEPRFSEVWIYHAWNMSYNISVVLTDHNDRWRWVRHGFSLLRDEGLFYNLDDPDMFYQLGWTFQHKIGAKSDDAHMVYKKSWAKEMEDLLGGGQPDFPALTEETKQRMLQEYKLDPDQMREIKENYGPLDWRMPQTHAIYWAIRSREVSQGIDILFADRMIYQSMAAAFSNGRIESGDDESLFIPSPHFELLPYVIKTYQYVMDTYPDVGEPVESFRNFLTEAIFLMYIYDRSEDAKPLLSRLKALRPEVPKEITVDDFVVSAYSSQQMPAVKDRKQAIVGKALSEAARYQKLGDSTRADGYNKLAELLKIRM